MKGKITNFEILCSDGNGKLGRIVVRANQVGYACSLAEKATKARPIAARLTDGKPGKKVTWSDCDPFEFSGEFQVMIVQASVTRPIDIVTVRAVSIQDACNLAIKRKRAKAVAARIVGGPVPELSVMDDVTGTGRVL